MSTRAYFSMFVKFFLPRKWDFLIFFVCTFAVAQGTTERIDVGAPNNGTLAIGVAAAATLALMLLALLRWGSNSAGTRETKGSN